MHLFTKDLTHEIMLQSKIQMTNYLNIYNVFGKKNPPNFLDATLARGREFS